MTQHDKTLRRAAVLAFGALAAAVAQGAPGQALAQDKGPAARALEIDTTIPSAPGFAVIDLSPTSIIDPGAARVSFASLLSHVDENGNLKPGFAVGGTPYFWLHPGVSLLEYKSASRFERILARTEISLGYAGGQASKPNKIGLGFTTELLEGRRQAGEWLDPTDYRLDATLSSCVNSAYLTNIGRPAHSGSTFLAQATSEWNLHANGLRPGEKVTDLPPTADGEAGTPPLEQDQQSNWITSRFSFLNQGDDDQRVARLLKGEAGKNYEAAAKTCRETAATRYAHRDSWIFAGGWALAEEGGGLKHVNSTGGSLWTAYRHPLKGKGLPVNYIALFARYDFDRKAEVTGGTQDFDKLSVALNLGYEKSKFKIAFQPGYQDISYGVGPLKDDTSSFYALTADMRVMDGVWIELKGGSSSNPEVPALGKDDRFTVSFRFSPQQQQ
ncbi:hypothetical protein [Caulobacter sp. X]|uniref:hypothetical protein n=1 Tax=Caulobacter sp. X TaxID=2048901 RepID=UPI00117873CC|nr:hypothetical protein [Caulobacter sp. X]